MSATWIQYKGKRIIYADYRGLKGNELIAALDSEAKLAQEAPGKVLILDDFTGSVADSAFMEYAKKVGKEIVEPKTEKCAILGVEGMKKVLLNAYNWFTGAGTHQRVFDSELAAKEWLVE
ncbi:hypothetical protein U14_02426 [Candidatus Moduliflexus flocculans]|uniref:STAS/SEC14 domain-containing protein n=1 Tax=Candidatus Moduliflexus flocculans TaxID=1499966 RepID=A0A081BLB8_9BACT|nr:hypothetical protein U14_02426 [Candidatus Moduliflexus flocculans]